ncbi:DUF3040 domain-containing protein [Streptomyces sp. NPDC057438]|uniref:DUF3040 domain-containing protein n=1 Tax=Streptomyces sp. NPDC057438 TaxID=3346133 RepID=UPI003678624C
MSAPKDEERVLARIEQRLASDDPEMARRIEDLNAQFTEPTGDDRPTDRGDLGAVTGRADKDDEEVTGLGLDDGEERSWTVKVALALVVLAAVGVLLTAILSVPGGGEQ